MVFVFVQQNIKGSFICEDSFDLELLTCNCVIMETNLITIVLYADLTGTSTGHSSPYRI